MLSSETTYTEMSSIQPEFAHQIVECKLTSEVLTVLFTLNTLSMTSALLYISTETLLPSGHIMYKYTYVGIS